MVRIPLLLLFFVWNVFCFGQTRQEVSVMFETAGKLQRTDPDSALVRSNELDAILDKNEYFNLKYKVEMLRGDAYLIKKENEKALDAYYQMDAVVSNDTIIQLQKIRISRYFRNIGDYPKALEYGLQGLDYSKKISDDRKLSGAHGNLASIYHRLDQNENALNQEQERIKISKRSRYTKGVFLGYYNSSQYLEKTRLEERLEFLNKADSINSNHLKNEYFFQIINLNLGESLHQMRKFDEALEVLDKVKEQSISTKNLNTRLYFLQVYVEVLNELKRHTEAKKYIAEGLKTAREINSLEHEEEFLKELEFTHRLQKNYKEAYIASKDLALVKDSLRNESILKEIEELNTKYNTAEKDAKLAQSELKINKRTGQRNIAIALISILSLLAFYLWRRNVYKQKLAKQNLALKNKKLEALEQEKQVLKLSAMLEGQEEERKRIAQDLHDGLGGLLSSAKSHISVVQDGIEKLENLNISQKATDMIDEAVAEVRRISQNLMPSSLRLKGLSDAISDLCQDLTQASGIQFSYEYKNIEDVTIDDKTSLSLFRMVQEACNNIMRHSNAKEVLIQFSIFGEEASLIIEDNGKGFDVNQNYPGVGLQSFSARTEQLNGMLDIDSKIGKGTTITINIPI